jgi:hypothetical protein
MPPYNPVTSKAQSRKLFALANRGEISMDEARGKTRSADFKSLPERAARSKSPRRGGMLDVKGAKRPKRGPSRR